MLHYHWVGADLQTPQLGTDTTRLGRGCYNPGIKVSALYLAFLDATLAREAALGHLHPGDSGSLGSPLSLPGEAGEGDTILFVILLDQERRGL